MAPVFVTIGVYTLVRVMLPRPERRGFTVYRVTMAVDSSPRL